MAKIKVLDLARNAGEEDDQLLLKLKRMGVKVKEKKPPEPEKTPSPSEEKVIGRDAERRSSRNGSTPRSSAEEREVWSQK